MSETQLVMRSPVGPLRLRTDGHKLTEIRFVTDPEESSDSPILRETQRQLVAYFAGELDEFDLPIEPSGTDFQRRVWQELLNIPYGETTSYGEVATRLGLPPSASRAVGLANGSNPISIVVPCHRVIGANGSLTGYGGGLDNKRLLLELESQRRDDVLF
ncbi:methylated-DNA--[protein]-cysteine S-methyltransferase [Solicola gregarius]|uniref:methylated-DNA--[protein]-cysteine S-methyltransferase n=1 Tax=Solicola gregarius TaxID=2908642 RepID=UPI0023058CEA|nr:methylated-DNA--[protein]-cysteine S-methyltransferase [Solicola gregarius]